MSHLFMIVTRDRMSMHINDKGPDGVEVEVPEEVLAWIDAGLPAPAPRGVTLWLDETPAHKELFEEYLRVWELSAAPFPPPGLWERVRSEIAEGRKLEAEWNGGGRSTRARLTWWRGPLAAAALVMLGLAPGLLWPRLQAKLGSRGQEVVIETPAGAMTTVALSEGITVRLNAASKLTFRQEGGHVGEVRLDGEAYFTVPHDPKRLFRVVTSAGVVRDIGTEFNVRARDGAVAVTVAEGEVELEAVGRAVRVQAGEESSARIGSPPTPARPADLAANQAWLEGAAVFRNQTLGVIAAELERRHGVPFIVAPSLRETRVTATIRGRTAEAAAQVICSVVAVRCRAAGEGWVIGDR